jgi:hypothetical protein
MKAKVLPHLVAWVRVGPEIPHGKVFVSLSLLSYSKEQMRQKEKKEGHPLLQYGATPALSQFVEQVDNKN